MSTEALLQEIVAELRQIRIALGGKGGTSQPASSQPSGNGNGSDSSKYAKRPDEKFSTCSRCGAQNVIWRESKAGKKYLVNPDGKFHSATCGK